MSARERVEVLPAPSRDISDADLADLIRAVDADHVAAVARHRGPLRRTLHGLMVVEPSADDENLDDIGRVFP